MVSKMPDNELDWETAGAAIRARRERLGLSQQTAADSVKMGVQTWRNIELARPAEDRRPTTLAKIEQALGWESGVIITVAQGHVMSEAGSPEYDALLRLHDERLTAMEHDHDRLRSLLEGFSDLAPSIVALLRSLADEEPPRRHP